MRISYTTIIALPDSDEKLTKLNRYGLRLGIFDKEPVIKEANRLRSLGYRDLTEIYLARILKK